MKIAPVSNFHPQYIDSEKKEKVSHITGKSSSVDLSVSSPVLRLSKESLRGSYLHGVGKDGVITLQEMEDFRDEKLYESDQLLKDIFTKLNITGSLDVLVDTDKHGQMIATGNISSQDQEKLEQVLNNHKEFKDAYTAAHSADDLVAAMEAQAEFQAFYAKNPKAAISKFIS